MVDLPRRISGEEWETLITLCGLYAWRVPLRWNIHDSYGDSDRPYCIGHRDDDGTETLDIYCPAIDGVLALAHEFGHAISYDLYPDCADWPTWKAEAFAMLSDMRLLAMRHTLDKDQRAAFAHRLRMVRKHASPDHLLGMKAAYAAVAKDRTLKGQHRIISAL